MNEEKKEEFEEKFCTVDETEPRIIRWKLTPFMDGFTMPSVPEIWHWIDSELKQARIDENKYHIQKINKSQEQFPTILDSERVTAMKEVFTNRIKELEK